jgi:DnaD/phage-associated family protein
MPKYRRLYTKIVDSFDFAEMPDDLTRIIWVLMIVVVDSEGRGIDSPSWINSRMFPLAPRALDDIENSMTWMNERGMIRRYVVNGRQYFDIPTFHNYQAGMYKEAASVIPAHPQLQSNSGVTPELVESNSSTYTVTVPVTDTVTVPVSNSPELGALVTAYERDFGAITPRLADVLADDLEQYGLQMCFDAMTEALKNNVRKWVYVQGILKRWYKDGRGVKTNGKSQAPQPGIAYFDVGAEREFYQDGKLIRTETLGEA